MIKQICLSILAGISIAIGGWVNLSVGKPLGPFLFAFGLITVVSYKFKLFTGTAGFTTSTKEFFELIPILLGNLLGVYLVALLAHTSQLDASAIVTSRLNQGVLTCGLLAIPCGFIMTTAVNFARQNNWLPLLFGVPVFIFCGFPHCVADLLYYFISDTFPILLWFCTVIGNYIGCNLYRILIRTDKPLFKIYDHANHNTQRTY